MSAGAIPNFDDFARTIPDFDAWQAPKAKIGPGRKSKSLGGVAGKPIPDPESTSWVDKFARSAAEGFTSGGLGMVSALAHPAETLAGIGAPLMGAATGDPEILGNLAGGTPWALSAGALTPSIDVPPLRSPIYKGESRIPTLGQLPGKMGIPKDSQVRLDPTLPVAIGYEAARRASGVRLRSPFKPPASPPSPDFYVQDDLSLAPTPPPVRPPVAPTPSTIGPEGKVPGPQVSGPVPPPAGYMPPAVRPPAPIVSPSTTGPEGKVPGPALGPTGQAPFGYGGVMSTQQVPVKPLSAPAPDIDTASPVNTKQVPVPPIKQSPWKEAVDALWSRYNPPQEFTGPKNVEVPPPMTSPDVSLSRRASALGAKYDASAAAKDDVMAGWAQKNGITSNQVMPGEWFEGLTKRINSDKGTNYKARINDPDHVGRVEDFKRRLDQKWNEVLSQPPPMQSPANLQ